MLHDIKGVHIIAQTPFAEDGALDLPPVSGVHGADDVDGSLLVDLTGQVRRPHVVLSALEVRLHAVPGRDDPLAVDGDDRVGLAQGSGQQHLVPHPCLHLADDVATFIAVGGGAANGGDGRHGQRHEQQ